MSRNLHMIQIVRAATQAKVKEMTKRQASQRAQKGTAIAESPIVLLTVLIFLAFPMINLGAIGYRSYFLIASCREAAHKAAKSLTFRQKAPIQVANNVPAETVAADTITRYLSIFNGVQIKSVRTGIVTINNKTGEKTGPVYNPVKTTYGNIYYLDVELVAEAVPMITYNGGLLGAIPGITAPVRIQTHAREVFENPKGLTM